MTSSRDEERLRSAHALLQLAKQHWREQLSAPGEDAARQFDDALQQAMVRILRTNQSRKPPQEKQQ